MDKKTKFFLSLVVFFLSNIGANAQVVNGYAKVTGIAGNVLSLANVNQTSHNFAVGEYVVVMQMQGDVIGANTTNATTFGNLSAISSTGSYEIERIVAINGTTTAGFTSAAPTTLTVNSLTGTYSTSANSSLQIITFRQMAVTNYSTTAAISALDWDGNVGGVVAIYVPGTLTLNHSITANSNGFRGGTVSNNNGGPQCDPANVTRYRENNANLGFKGEGIYKNTTNTYNNGRAKILNGGGGGGNYTAGGLGGNGYNNCTTNPGGGFGGISLSSVIDGGRVFMGGGGGGGQQNNSQGRNGGDGGGIVLIKANQITSGTCAGVTVAANGGTPATGGTNDGGGGGGAGGSLVFWVNTWNILGTCPISITANGGNGSTSNDGAAHAGGAAGGQGVVIFNGATPSTNVTVTTANGTPGCNNNSSPCTNSAGTASGSSNAGIIANTSSPLPIELIDFKAEIFQESDAYLSWKTASELNNDYFSILKSTDGENWVEIGQVNGAGNSSELITYDYFDRGLMPGLNYYKLKQVDFNGDYSFSPVRTVMVENSDVLVYPNPFENQLTIQSENEILSVALYSAEGRILINQTGNGSDMVPLNLNDLPPGTYFVEIQCVSGSVFKRVIKG